MQLPSTPTTNFVQGKFVDHVDSFHNFFSIFYYFQGYKLLLMLNLEQHNQYQQAQSFG